MHKGLRVDSVQWWRVENPLISILLVYKQPWSFIFKYDQILIKLPKKWDVLNILIMLYNLVKRYKEKRFQKSNDSHINIVLFIAPTADRRRSRAFRYQTIFLYYLFFWCSGTRWYHIVLDQTVFVTISPDSFLTFWLIFQNKDLNMILLHDWILPLLLIFDIIKISNQIYTEKQNVKTNEDKSSGRQFA